MVAALGQLAAFSVPSILNSQIRGQHIGGRARLTRKQLENRWHVQHCRTAVRNNVARRKWASPLTASFPSARGTGVVAQDSASAEEAPAAFPSQEVSSRGPPVCKSVVIVGAGLAGLATAVALHQRGVRVKVFEQKQLQEKCISTRCFSLYPNGLSALGLIEPSLPERLIREAGAVVKMRTVQSWDGCVFSSQECFFEAAYGYPMVHCRCGTVERLLIDMLPPGTVRFGSRLTGVTQKPDFVEARFEGSPGRRSQQMYRADLLVGADGVNSVARSCILDRVDATMPQDMCRTAWRAIIPRPPPGAANSINFPPNEIRISLGGVDGSFCYVTDVGRDELYWIAMSMTPARQPRSASPFASPTPVSFPVSASTRASSPESVSTHASSDSTADGSTPARRPGVTSSLSSAPDLNSSWASGNDDSLESDGTATTCQPELAGRTRIEPAAPSRDQIPDLASLGGTDGNGTGTVPFSARSARVKARAAPTASSAYERVMEQFGGWRDMRALLEMTRPDQVVEEPLAIMPGLDSWHSHRAIVIGDAAHAATPALGLGANMAFEDAWELAQVLAPTPRPADPHEDAGCGDISSLLSAPLASTPLASTPLESAPLESAPSTDAPTMVPRTGDEEGKGEEEGKTGDKGPVCSAVELDPIEHSLREFERRRMPRVRRLMKQGVQTIRGTRPGNVPPALYTGGENGSVTTPGGSADAGDGVGQDADDEYSSLRLEEELLRFPNHGRGVAAPSRVAHVTHGALAGGHSHATSPWAYSLPRPTRAQRSAHMMSAPKISETLYSEAAEEFSPFMLPSLCVFPSLPEEEFTDQ